MMRAAAAAALTTTPQSNRAERLAPSRENRAAVFVDERGGEKGLLRG